MHYGTFLKMTGDFKILAAGGVWISRGIAQCCDLHSKTPIPSVTVLHCDYMVDSESVVTFTNCWLLSDYTATGSLVTLLPAVSNGDYPLTVQSLCSHSLYLVGDRWNRSFVVYCKTT